MFSECEEIFVDIHSLKFEIFEILNIADLCEFLSGISQFQDLKI